MAKTIGILGVGHLAGFLVEGLRRGGAEVEIVLSPRNRDKAEALAAAHDARIAEDNQALVDRSDMILACLPAAQGRDILHGLQFRPDQTVLSAMAGTSHGQLAPLVAPASAFVTMMPGAANALGCGPSLLFPQDDNWAGLLAHFGTVIPLASEQEFEVAAVFGGLSGASFAWMREAMAWFQKEGMSEAAAQALVGATLRGNAEVILQPGASLAEITTGVATPGGITRQVVDHLNTQGRAGRVVRCAGQRSRAVSAKLILIK